MYSNMSSRQWFIRVKCNTDKQKNRLRHPYTDFKSRRTKFAATVSRTNLAKTSCRRRRQRCVGSPHPTEPQRSSTRAVEQQKPPPRGGFIYNSL